MDRINYEVSKLKVLLKDMDLSADACEFVYRVLDIAQEGLMPLPGENIAPMLPSWDSARVESALEELRHVDLVSCPTNGDLDFFSIDDLNVEYKVMLLLEEQSTNGYLQSLTEHEQNDVEIIFHRWVMESYFNNDCWHMLAALSEMTIDTIRANLEAYSVEDLGLAIQNYAEALYSDRLNVIPAMDLLTFLTVQDDYGLSAWKWFLLDTDTDV
jgi:hypothetical protein